MDKYLQPDRLSAIYGKRATARTESPTSAPSGARGWQRARVQYPGVAEPNFGDETDHLFSTVTGSPGFPHRRSLVTCGQGCTSNTTREPSCMCCLKVGATRIRGKEGMGVVEWCNRSATKLEELNVAQIGILAFSLDTEGAGLFLVKTSPGSVSQRRKAFLEMWRPRS